MLSTKKLKKCLVACCYYSKSSPQGNQNSRERERERETKSLFNLTTNQLAIQTPKKDNDSIQ